MPNLSTNTSLPPLLPSRHASLLPNGQSSTIISQTRKRDHQSYVSDGTGLSDTESEQTSHESISKRAKTGTFHLQWQGSLSAVPLRILYWSFCASECLGTSSSESISAVAGNLSTLGIDNTTLTTTPQPKVEDQMEIDKVIDPQIQEAIRRFLVANFVYDFNWTTRASSGNYNPPGILLESSPETQFNKLTDVPIRPILCRTLKISNLFVSGINASKILKRFKKFGATSVTLPLLNLHDRTAKKLSLQDIQFNQGFAFIVFSSNEKAQFMMNSYLSCLSAKTRGQRRKASGPNAFFQVAQGLARTKPRLEIAATQEIQEELFRIRAGACLKTYREVGNRFITRMDIARADSEHFGTSFLGELFRSFKPVKALQQ